MQKILARLHHCPLQPLVYLAGTPCAAVRRPWRLPTPPPPPHPFDCSFRPNVALSFVRDLLLFDDDEECVAFIQAAGGVVEGWTGPAGETGASTTAPSPTPGLDGAAKPCVWNTVASKIESFKQVVPEPEEDEPE